MHSPFIKEVADSADSFRAKRWEGKPFPLKLKYAVANYPEMCFSFISLFILAPIVIAYKATTYKDKEKYALTKFRLHYTVVRDDDPNIAEIRKDKELIKKFFPC